jgi:hypothetical protein
MVSGMRIGELNKLLLGSGIRNPADVRVMIAG